MGSGKERKSLSDAPGNEKTGEKVRDSRRLASKLPNGPFSKTLLQHVNT
jgi:hypothetical protein